MRLFLIAALAVFPAMAAAQQCIPREKVVERLVSKYEEQRVAVATNSQGIVETWASESGSWTIFMTLPGGLACLLAGGEDFELVDEVEPASLGTAL